MDYSSFLLDIKGTTEAMVTNFMDTLMVEIQEKTFKLMKHEYNLKKDQNILFPAEWTIASDFKKRVGYALMALCLLCKKKASIQFGKSKADAEADFKDAYYSRRSFYDPYNNQAISFYDAFSYDCCEWILNTLMELHPEHIRMLMGDFSSLYNE